jgi:membrane protease YdiL (CAAX protease family)
VILPVIFLVSRSPDFYRYYPLSNWLGEHASSYARSGSPDDWLIWLIVFELGYAIYFLGWEYFFRGYLTFGLHARMGILGVFVGNIPFALMHANKPFPEAMGSIVAGLALGVFALRARSFWYAWAVHVLAAWSMDLWALERRISLGS